VPAGNADYRADLVLVDVVRAVARPVAGGCGFEASWSPDGALIACSGTRQVAVYDTAGHRHFVLPGVSAAWSTRGLAVSGDGHVRILDRRGRRLAQVPGTLLAWTRDGRTLALAQRGRVVLRRSGGPARVVYSHAHWSPLWARFTPD